MKRNCRTPVTFKEILKHTAAPNAERLLRRALASTLR